MTQYIVCKVWNISATYGSPQTLTGHDGIVLALCVKEYVLLLFLLIQILITYFCISLFCPLFLSLFPLPSVSHLLYSGASDKTIKVWSVKTLLMGASFVAHEDPVCTLAASSTMLFSGSLRSIKVSNEVPPPVGFSSHLFLHRYGTQLHENCSRRYRVRTTG